MTDTGETLEILARGGDESRGTLRLVRRAVDVGALKASFEDFMSKLQSVVELDREQETAFQLAEIQFSAEITGDGGFRLLGTGAGLQATSSVTFTLQRRPRDAG